MAPTISVVIPTYNRLPILREALDSVLRQARVPDEILVIDDGSSDGTEGAIGALPAPVRYIRQQNAGPAAARNRGLREARGDWIAFLDSDDLWLPGRLASQLAFLERNPSVDFVFGTQVNQKDGVRESAPEILNRHIYRQLQAGATGVPDFFSLLLQGNPVPTSSVLFRRSCIAQVGYFEEHRWRCEDYDLWLRFAVHCRVGFVDEILVAKRSQDDNLINDYMKLWSAHLDVLRCLPPKLPQLNLPANPLWDRVIAQTIYRLGSFQLNRGEIADAQRWFGELEHGDLPLLSRDRWLAFIKSLLLRLRLGRLAQCQRAAPQAPSSAQN